MQLLQAFNQRDADKGYHAIDEVSEGEVIELMHAPEKHTWGYVLADRIVMVNTANERVARMQVEIGSHGGTYVWMDDSRTSDLIMLRP